jgi:hypothetical protein
MTTQFYTSKHQIKKDWSDHSFGNLTLDQSFQYRGNKIVGMSWHFKIVVFQNCSFQILIYKQSRTRSIKNGSFFSIPHLPAPSQYVAVWFQRCVSSSRHVGSFSLHRLAATPPPPTTMYFRL